MNQLTFWGYFILSFCVLAILWCAFALIYSILGYIKYGNGDYNWMIPISLNLVSLLSCLVFSGIIFLEINIFRL